MWAGEEFPLNPSERLRSLGGVVGIVAVSQPLQCPMPGEEVFIDDDTARDEAADVDRTNEDVRVCTDGEVPPLLPPRRQRHVRSRCGVQCVDRRRTQASEGTSTDGSGGAIEDVDGANGCRLLYLGILVQNLRSDADLYASLDEAR